MPKITLTIPSVYETEGVRLLPGVNTITSDQLDALMRNGLVVADMDAGLLVLSDDNPAPTIDAAALIEIAKGDARKSEVKDARAKLEEMGLDWQ
jgi:hypothetical protein